MRFRTAMLAAAIAATGTFAAGAALADEGQDFLKSKGCLGCHDMEKKKVGPAFKDVAAKYKSQAGAADKLAGEIGGAGKHPKVKATEAEVKQAVGIVLK